MSAADKEGRARYDIDFERLHLSVKWNTVLMPFEQSRFVSLLPDEGYNLDEGLRGMLPLGTQGEASGPIARKGTTVLIADAGRLVLGIEAKDTQTLVEEFNSIEDVLRTRLFFESSRHALFYEVLAQALVWTKVDAFEVLRKLMIGSTLAARFTEKTGIGPATSVSLRLVPAKGEVQSPDWWDFHIEPSFRSPHHCYRFIIVYRNPDRQRVIEFAKGIRPTISITTELLEESNE